MDVKKRIMHEEKWPKDFLPVSEVGRLRIFSGGKELEDNKTLSESKIMVNPSVPTPIHVSAVPKSVQAGKHYHKKYLMGHDRDDYEYEIILGHSSKIFVLHDAVTLYHVAMFLLYPFIMRRV
ncbi:hypothetical protein Pmar_PMAR011741 [Perkinsus marinus ATCC 50983]|uniref:UBL3-like ubiquitin domain-containing protein n=1 Tax=Perkinsus marinus (strain ATCC 50983 / TXsc) TaxID=423536 RepID=C5LCL2_PERM5|nr:hypothetical protein Pmar_PMAR011741 [Perkinsus marinus ATCC 50983]EER05695.1 hypothetical protein Pmar_PMAR011741 [Perkinsus marinus ATCC 50983]|eukprot:XP_002773879.1 hypothetical protein Pmar_PMAR011741 [Perkinsus marinus ATCC 50983]